MRIVYIDSLPFVSGKDKERSSRKVLVLRDLHGQPCDWIRRDIVSGKWIRGSFWDEYETTEKMVLDLLEYHFNRGDDGP